MGCECNKSSLDQDKKNEINQEQEQSSLRQDLTQINPPKIQLSLNKEKEEINSNIEPTFKKDKEEVISQIGINININQNENEEEKKSKNFNFPSQDNSFIQIKNNSLSPDNSIIKKEKENENEKEKKKFDKNENDASINYNLKVIELINNIRANPSIYEEKIEESKKNIRIEKAIIKDKITGEEIEKDKIIYKKKLKVALTRGEISFDEAANYLKSLKPIPPLEYDENIVLKLPENESQMKDSSYLKLQAEEVKRRFNVDCYFKDFIKDPYISTLLMIVDDNGKNVGKKRKALLNPEYKYIGVDCKFFGKAFVAYFSFSKSK